MWNDNDSEHYSAWSSFLSKNKSKGNIYFLLESREN